MRAVATALRREDAKRVLRALAIQKISAEFRDHENTRSSGKLVLDVVVSDKDFERSLEVVSLIFAEGDSDHPICDVLTDAEASKRRSIVFCPRCGEDTVGYPDDPSPRTLLFLLFASLPLLGIPALVWLVHKQMKGSKKECPACHHAWRSKP